MLNSAYLQNEMRRFAMFLAGFEDEYSLTGVKRSKEYPWAVPPEDYFIQQMMVRALKLGARPMGEGTPEEFTQSAFSTQSGIYLRHLGKCYREYQNPYFEISTVHATDPFELFKRVRMGQQMVGFLAREVATEDYVVRCFNAVSDRRGLDAESCGMHGNYLMSRGLRERIFADIGAFTEDLLTTYSWSMIDLISFEVLLKSLTGAGKVGYDRKTTPAYYQISERADFVERYVAGNTSDNRPIVNTRDEPHADAERFARHHGINREGNRSPWASFLDSGLHMIFFDALEHDALVLPWRLRGPLGALHALSRDLTLASTIPIVMRRTKTSVMCSPLLLLRGIIIQLKCHVARHHLSSWCDEILEQALTLVDQMRAGDYALADRTLDWRMKKRFLEDVMKERFSLDPDNPRSWKHPRVRTMDLDYHRMDDERMWQAVCGQMEVLDWEKYGNPYGSPSEDLFWRGSPPDDTRSYLIWYMLTTPHLKERTRIYDWDCLGLWNESPRDEVILRLPDPRCSGKEPLLQQFGSNPDFSTQESRAAFLRFLEEGGLVWTRKKLTYWNSIRKRQEIDSTDEEDDERGFRRLIFDFLLVRRRSLPLPPRHEYREEYQPREPEQPLPLPPAPEEGHQEGSPLWYEPDDLYDRSLGILEKWPPPEPEQKPDLSKPENKGLVDDDEYCLE